MKINKVMLYFFLYGLVNVSYAFDQGMYEFAHDEPLLQLAEISFSEKPSTTVSKKRKPETRSIIPQPRNIEQYEIEGYIDQEYVRAVLEVEDKQTVVGNIYDEEGNGVYVYGEYLDGALHVYDPKGTHFTIILSE